MRYVALMIATAAVACHPKGIEQVDFHVVFRGDDGHKIDQLARNFGEATGMKVFYGASNTLPGGQRTLEVYNDETSIDILSFPCDPARSGPNLTYSSDAFFVIIASRAGVSGSHDLEHLSEVVKQETLSLGGKISRTAPACRS
jgi:hypothetical protein